MSKDVNFASTVINGSFVFNNNTQTNTNLDGSGTLNTTIFKLYESSLTGNGAKISKINVGLLRVCVGSSIRFFIGTDSVRVFKTAFYIKPAPSSSLLQTIEKICDIDLAPGQNLYVTCSNPNGTQNSFAVTIEGGAY